MGGVLVVLVAIVVFVPIVVPGVRSLHLVSPLPLLARGCPHSRVEEVDLWLRSQLQLLG